MGGEGSVTLDQWLARVRRELGPALAHDAGFWQRWAASRYLTDEFERAFEAAGELMERVQPLLDRPTAARLVDDHRAIGRLRTDFLALAGERGGALAASACARSLVETLQRWCAELEGATREMRVTDLPPDVRELLGRLRTEAPAE